MNFSAVVQGRNTSLVNINDCIQGAVSSGRLWQGDVDLPVEKEVRKSMEAKTKRKNQKRKRKQTINNLNICISYTDVDKLLVYLIGWIASTM